MGDWFFGLVTGIILTTIVGWACLRRRFRVTSIKRTSDVAKVVEEKDGSPSRFETDKWNED